MCNYLLKSVMELATKDQVDLDALLRCLKRHVAIFHMLKLFYSCKLPVYVKKMFCKPYARLVESSGMVMWSSR